MGRYTYVNTVFAVRLDLSTIITVVSLINKLAQHMKAFAETELPDDFDEENLDFSTIFGIYI